MDTKQPASRLQQILGILDSDVIVTSEKYLKDLEKLEFKGKVLMAPDLVAEQENEAVLNEIREQALDVDPLYGIFYFRVNRSSQGSCGRSSFSA